MIFRNFFKNLQNKGLYADNTQQIITAKTIPKLKENLKTGIHTAQKLFKTNGMKMNSDKTNILILNTHPDIKNLESEIEHNGENIEKSSEQFIEILGIYVDQELNWK